MKNEKIQEFMKDVNDTIRFRLPLYTKYIMGAKTIGKFNEYWGRKKIIVIYTPSYGECKNQHGFIDYNNVSTLEEETIDYLEGAYKDYKILSFNINSVFIYAKAIEDVLGNEDIIFFTEGSVNGERIKKEEWTKNFVYTEFKNYNIEILPKEMVYKSKRTLLIAK